MFAYIGNNDRVHGYESHNEYAPDYAVRLVALNADTEEDAALEAPPHWVYDWSLKTFSEPPAPPVSIEHDEDN